MRFFLISATLALLLTACGGGSEYSLGEEGSNLQVLLAKNTEWPYEMVGVLDIVEAGGYDDVSEYPTWAIGNVITADDEWGVMIEIGDGVVSRAKINIDSGEEVRLWLEKPHKKYDVLTYPVSRIEAL